MAFQATVALLGLATSLAAAAATLCALVVLWWALGSSGAPAGSAKGPPPGPFAPLAQAQRHVESAPADPELTLSVDVEAIQAQIWDQSDLELDILCEHGRDDPSARALRNLEDEIGGPPAAAEPPPKPGTDLELFQKGMELHNDMVLEGMCSHAIDDQCAAVLKSLEEESRGPSALDDDTQREYVEMEDSLSKQAAEGQVMEGPSMTTAGTLDAALEEYHQMLLVELESMNRPTDCANLLEMIVERVRKAGEFLLWII